MSLPKHSVSTAEWAAAGRAWHLRNTLPLFEDPYAEVLCGRFLRLVLHTPPLQWLLFKVVLTPILPATMCVLMRARYAEESLEQAIRQGIRQYVILGAGMDSFAFRRADLLERITAFELDHPVTQAKKLSRIRKAGWNISANHHFVAVDLSEVSVTDALANTPFDSTAPAFVSLLGVSYYLTPEDLSTAARGIAKGMGPGTRMVLDYLLDPESSDPETVTTRHRMLSFVEKRGEPMRSSYSLEGLQALMEGAGFRAGENFRMTDLTDDYTRDIGPVEVKPPDMFGFGNFEVA